MTTDAEEKKLGAVAALLTALFHARSGGAPLEGGMSFRRASGGIELYFEALPREDQRRMDQQAQRRTAEILAKIGESPVEVTRPHDGATRMVLSKQRALSGALSEKLATLLAQELGVSVAIQPGPQRDLGSEIQGRG